MALGVAILFVCGSAAIADEIRSLDVDCAGGESIVSALQRHPQRPLLVTIKGTCVENVRIVQDDVVLQAHASGGEVEAADTTRAAIRIDGARRVTIDRLRIRNGFHGVELRGTGTATLKSMTISGAVRNGIDIQENAVATVDASVIESNGRSGIAVFGAGATITSSTVRANRVSGVVVARGSWAVFGAINVENVICCGNTIENNTLDGITVADNANVVLYDNTIRSNARGGILAFAGSNARLVSNNHLTQNGSGSFGGGILLFASTLVTGNGDTPVSGVITNDISDNPTGIVGNTHALVDLRRGVNVTGNALSGVFLNHGSRLRMEVASIANNGFNGIFLVRGSTVEVVGPTGNLVSGNRVGLLCDGPETSYSGNVVGIAGNTEQQISTGCTGF